MQYQRFGDTIIVRMDKDEEILEQPSFLYNPKECPCPRGESAACPRYRDCDACVAYHRTPGNPPKTACEKRAEES